MSATRHIISAPFTIATGNSIVIPRVIRLSTVTLLDTAGDLIFQVYIEGGQPANYGGFAYLPAAYVGVYASMYCTVANISPTSYIVTARNNDTYQITTSNLSTVAPIVTATAVGIPTTGIISTYWYMDR